MAKIPEKEKFTGQIVIDTEVLGDEPAESAADLSAVQVHNSVIAGIARIAALNVPGVSELSAGFAEGFATVFGTKKASERGVRIEHDGDFVSIHVHVVVEYGVRIPHVAWQVQNEVRRAVEQMTGKSVHNVRVLVQGVKLPAGRPQNRTEAQT